ncbi:MAG: hypothetical protein ACQEQM_04240 [Thermoplasmatota archaeon]
MEEKKLTRSVIFTASLLFTIILYIIAKIPSAEGYEVDIYGVYPWYLWGLMIASLSLGSIAVLLSKSKNFIKYGFVIIVVTNLILLSLQFFRGYFFFVGGDLFTHVGFAKDILSSGHIPSFNFYPFQHVLTLDLYLICSISLEMSSRMLSIIFYLLFVISLYVFLRNYSLTKFKFCLILGIFLIFGSQNLSPLPNILSFLFFPMILFLLTKIELDLSKLRLNAMLFIVVLSVIFFHPITSLYLLGILVLFKLGTIILYEYFNNYYDLSYLNFTIILSFVAWVSWHMGFSSLRMGITRTISSIFYDPSLNPRAEEYTNTLGMFDIQVIDILKKFIFEFGMVSVLLLLVIVYLAYMTYDRKKIKRFLKHRDILFLGGSVFLFAAWSTINFFADFVTFTRVFKFVILFSSLLLGLIFSFNTSPTVNFDFKDRVKHLSVLSILVVFILLISVFRVYPAPISFSSNLQVTQQENEGMEWFFEVQDEDKLIWEEGIRQHRWADFVYGSEGDERPENIRVEPNVENHFGYEERERMEENYTGYFIKTDIHMITYRHIFSDYEGYWRFNESSYEEFDRDPSVNKIYNNGFFESYDINEVDEG